jgi:hypothetical protein
MMPPPATKPPSRMPSTIGRYRIQARLGRGAMGIVYSARDDQLERNVALKVMMADLESDPETRARFYREAQITGKLLHRNIITVFDLGEEDGRLYLVMELLSGCTLAEFMKDGESPSLEQKLDLMIQTCEGLSSAHAKGIIHRDIKPSNLFVQTDGGLKILDFGIARLASSSMTMSGMIMGTPDYMSPEQAQGKEVDARSDIFSAAGVFYFMLTGRRPFEAPALPGVLHKVVREDPLPIRAHEAPSALAQVIAKGLQKDPARRYQRCGDMAAEIVKFKRQFDNETRQLVASARARFDRVIELASMDGELRDALEMAPCADVDQSVRERFPFFATGDHDLAAIIPLNRDQVMAILEELNDVLTPLALDVNALRRATACVEAGDAAWSSGDARAALHHFERASAGLSDPSARIAARTASAREAAGPMPELEPPHDEMRVAKGTADESHEATEQRKLEAAQMLEEARKQLSERNYDRAAWVAENALLVCPGYEPALEVLAEARSSLAAGMLRDPDDTVQLSSENRMALDPAATVIIPIAAIRVPAAAETWTSRLRRRLRLTHADTKANVSQKTRGVGSR